MDIAAIELLMLDVDGVLTDGSLRYGAEGETGKTFFVQDGWAIKEWQACGGKTAIITGRDGEALRRRAADLGIRMFHQGVTEKLAAYERVRDSVGCPDDRIAVVGDDHPDIAPMRRCGFPIAVQNAVPAVKRAAAYVTRRAGGSGAIAEIVELLLRKKGLWGCSAAIRV